jgi:hypothetical protein
MAMADTAHADYYAQGTILSNNMLSGATGVSAIASVTVTATLPTNTTAKIKYSQDNANFYNAAGTQEGWDTIAAGTNAINISARGWTGGILYYKIQWTTIDDATTPTISDVTVDYTGDVAAAPNCSSHCQTSGAFVSTDLMTGVATAMRGTERFAYSIPSLPGGSSVTAQFSQDGANWYSSAGTLWGSDTLSSGVHMNETTALSLAALNWADGTHFYYKLNLTTTDDTQVPTITYAGLLFAQMTTLGSQLDGPSKSNLVGWWTFDGNDMTNTLAYDKSGQGNDGTLTNGPTKTIGYLGQGLSFDGVDDVVVVPDADVFTQSALTVSFWKKDINNSADRQFVGKRSSGNRSWGVVGNDGDRALKFIISDAINTENNNATTPNGGMAVGQWYHVVAVFNGAGSGNSGRMQMYIDGVAQSLTFTGTIPATLVNNTNTVDIGLGYYGSLDDVRIYNTALTASQVSDLYKLGTVIQKRP